MRDSRGEERAITILNRESDQVKKLNSLNIRFSRGVSQQRNNSLEKVHRIHKIETKQQYDKKKRGCPH